ncbi:MAG: YesL family protein [Lachnospiraceae bacterium]|nr:YesL family protein [Lachnospiraceae bacterium]
MSGGHNSYNKISESDNKNADTRPFLRRAMDGFGNIFALNICFVISCLPVITIGASLAALYSMCIRLQDGREETVLAGYITEFKKNFKQATKAFLVILAYLAVMLAEYIMINNIEGGISTFYTYVLLVEVVFFCLVVPFVFPLIACYENTLFNTFKNSFILSIGYLGSWIKIFIAWFAPIAFCVIYPTLFLYLWYMWLLFIFGAIAYGTSFTIRKVFNRNKELEENTEKKAEEEAKEAKKKAK